MTQPYEGLRFETPVDGVHYLTDLYSAIGANQSDDTAAIRNALRDRTKEYSTDRQLGTAPEFGETAQHRMLIINRAREILLSDRRSEYDDLLASWTERDGPISQDGSPVIAIGSVFAPRIVGESAEQVEVGFQHLFAELDRQPGVGTEERVELVERRLERARSRGEDEEEINFLQDDYEDVLYALDIRLAVEEQQRSQRALGRDISAQDGRHWRVTDEYGQETEEEVAQLRERRIEDMTALASGSFATRLAILAGETTPTSDVVPVRDAADYALPIYFDDQANRVKDLARRRQDIMRKRVANMRVSHPEAELQTEPGDRILVGLAGEEATEWYNISEEPLPEGAVKQLLAGNYVELIRTGYSVITTRHLENIAEEVLVNGAIEAHVRYYSQEDQA